MSVPCYALPCSGWPHTHDEAPSLNHLLNDPIVRLLMARDGVQADTLRALLIGAARIRRQVRGETLRSAAQLPPPPQGSTGELNANRRGWVISDEDARSMLQQMRSASGPRTLRCNIETS